MVVAVVSVNTLDGPTAARANSYDDGWQSDWVAHASSLLRSAENQKTRGFVPEIGDSITHSYAFAMWPVGGAGKSESDADVLAATQVPQPAPPPAPAPVKSAPVTSMSGRQARRSRSIR